MKEPMEEQEFKENLIEIIDVLHEITKLPLTDLIEEIHRIIEIKNKDPIIYESLSSDILSNYIAISHMLLNLKSTVLLNSDTFRKQPF